MERVGEASSAPRRAGGDRYARIDLCRGASTMWRRRPQDVPGADHDLARATRALGHFRQEEVPEIIAEQILRVSGAAPGR